jgi:lysosomal acid lipase/cholesteryl ester hydrolase
MSPPGLSAPLVDTMMKTSPTLLYLIFGRKSILSSALTWQSILYPPIFANLIDLSLGWLFDWHSVNISDTQKVAAYAHLYSYTSVKAVVHWFQIMRNGEFVMFDDDANGMMPSLRASKGGIGDEHNRSRRKNNAYRPARFPTRNIVTPIVLLYGGVDSLVDIDMMLSLLPQLPADRSNVTAKCLQGYEHLDVLWGKNVHKDVIPEVLNALEKYRRKSLDEDEADESEGIKVGGITDQASVADATDFTNFSD